MSAVLSQSGAGMTNHKMILKLNKWADNFEKYGNLDKANLLRAIAIRIEELDRTIAKQRLDLKKQYDIGRTTAIKRHHHLG